MSTAQKASRRHTAAVAPATGQTYEQLTRLLRNLQDTRERLMYVQPELLSEDEHKQWNEEVYQVGLAISAVRKTILQGINAGFSVELPAINKSVDKLTDDLYELKEVNARIAAVASMLGIITSIVTLVG